MRTDTAATIVIPEVRLRKRTLWLVLAGWPALLPLVFMLPPILVYDTDVLHGSGNDVLGSGGAVLLFAMLAVTPASMLTGQRWFNPALRQWYGILFGVDVITDAIIAATDSSFADGVAGRLAGHAFLLLGFTMVLLSIPLLITANRRSQRELGKYWRPVQRYGTYAIWGLLFAHLTVLEGFGVIRSDPLAIVHQRLYQVAAISAPLVLLRVPVVKRWVKAQRKRGRMPLVWLALSPLLAVALVAYAFLWNELVVKGSAAFTLRILND